MCSLYKILLKTDTHEGAQTAFESMLLSLDQKGKTDWVINVGKTLGAN